MSDGHLIPIHGITYDISFDEVIEEIVIEASGKAMRLLKSIDGSVNKVLCDLDLKRIAFDDNGNAVVKG